MFEISQRSSDVKEPARSSVGEPLRERRPGDELVASFAGAPGATRIVVSESRRLDEARRIAIALGVVSPIATTLMVDRAWRAAAVELIALAARPVNEIIDCSLGYGRATMSVNPQLCGTFPAGDRAMRAEALQIAARIVNESTETRIASDLASRLVETADYEHRWSFSRAYRRSDLLRAYADPGEFLRVPAWDDRLIDRKFEPLCLLETARLIPPIEREAATQPAFALVVDGGWDPVIDGFVRRIASDAFAGSHLATERQVRPAEEDGWPGCVSVGLNLHERMSRGVLYGQQDDVAVFDGLRRLPPRELERVGLTGDFNVRLRRLGEAKQGIAFDGESVEIVAMEGLAERLIDRYRFGLVGSESKARSGGRWLRRVARSLRIARFA
jgi:hypothetical protein